MSAEAAVTSAEAALASAQKGSDKKAEVAARKACIKAYKELPDHFAALKCANELLKLSKASGDTKAQAEAMLTIGEMHYVMDNLEDALKHEQEALDLFKRANDSVGQENAKTALDKVFNKQGNVEDAPNRQKGLAALAEMDRAIQGGDNTRFNEAMERCKRMDSISDADIEDTLSKALETNYFKAAKMYKDVLNFENMLPEEKAVQVNDRYHYMAFRTTGGLQYGPAFQYVRNVNANRSANTGMAPIIINEDRDSWELGLAYNHGVVDGMLQVQMSLGLTGWQQEGQEAAFKRAQASDVEQLTN